MKEQKLVSAELFQAVARGLDTLGRSPLFRAIMEAEYDYRNKQTEVDPQDFVRRAVRVNEEGAVEVWLEREVTLNFVGATESIEFKRLHRIIHNAGKNAGDLYMALNSYHKRNKARGRNLRKAAELRDSLGSLSKLLGEVDEPGLADRFRKVAKEAAEPGVYYPPYSDPQPLDNATEAELREAHIFKMIKDASALIHAESGGPIEVGDKLQEIMNFIQYQESIPTTEVPEA